MELGVSLRSGSSEHTLLAALNQHLISRAAEDRRVVICLDEAQAMPRESLEMLRLVSNLETEKRKLVQIVLFGQPELDRRLARPNLRQLASRIAFHYELGCLSRDETERYLAHRLRIAGHQGGELFISAVARRLHAVTGGVPRLLNIVAHKALLLAYGEGALRVSAAHLRLAARDTPSARRLGIGARLAAWFARQGAGALS
jgi:MSHA biogenesis protein MshM